MEKTSYYCLWVYRSAEWIVWFAWAQSCFYTHWLMWLCWFWLGLTHVSTWIRLAVLLILAGLSHMFRHWLAMTWSRMVLARKTGLFYTWPDLACFHMAEFRCRQGARTQVYTHTGVHRSPGGMGSELAHYHSHCIPVAQVSRPDSCRGKTEFYLFMEIAMK
jgi:hypothetical protein